MAKHISIHKAEFHKSFYINSEENEDLLDDILSVDKFVYPLKDKNHYYLYDVENKTLLNKSTHLQSFQIEKNTEILSFIGVSPAEVQKLKIPKKTKHLIFEGGDLMPLQLGKTIEGDLLWKEIINNLNLYKFVETIPERLAVENELRNIYNNEIPKCIGDFGLPRLFEKIEETNVSSLTIAWTYFSDFDFQMLSKLHQLQELSILYCYNDNVKWLPQNLTFLKIYGTTIQNLSELNLDLSKLTDLDLEGNTLKSLDKLQTLSEHLEKLTLSNNLIAYFDINSLPDNLEYLDLSQNLIDNNFFNQKANHKNLKVLKLRANKIVVTSSILHVLLELFPNLEYLELLENDTDGVPFEFLGDFEDKNCLSQVQYFLEGLDFKHNGGNLLISEFRKQPHFIEVGWCDQLLPLRVILSDIQYNFSKHFIKVPSFKKYLNGLHCFIEHDNCDVFMEFHEENKEIIFKVQSDKPETVALYFHKYLQDVNGFISFNSHIHILPSVHNSDSCNFLKDFFQKAMKVDYKLKNDFVLSYSKNNLQILINNISNNTVKDDGKFAFILRENIEDVAFILISGKGAYPFVIKNGVVTNSYKLGMDYYYYITLRTAIDKENYVKGITSRYLNSSKLIQKDIFIDNDVKKKISCYLNPKYFHANEMILSTVTIEFPVLQENYLKDIKMDNGKWCKFNLDSRDIQLKYVL